MTPRNKLVGLALALAAGAAALAPTASAWAQPYDTRYDADQARSQADYARADQARRDYDAQYGAGAYDRYYAAQSDRTYRQDRRECRHEKSDNGTAGALLGGIAGAVIGSNLASGGGRTGGAVIGGVGGAVAGSAIAKGTVHCDD
jgi:uncharacterized protein YcfJ